MQHKPEAYATFFTRFAFYDQHGKGFRGFTFIKSKRPLTRLTAIPFNEGDSVGSLQLGRWHEPLACGHAEHRPEAYATETLASLNGIAVKRIDNLIRI